MDRGQKRKLTGAVAVLVLLVIAALGLRGRGLRVYAIAKVRLIFHTIRAIQDQDTVSSYSQGDFTNIIFLHHSTGHNLIHQGDVREHFANAGYAFWDHSYNAQGMTRPDGTSAGYSYNIPEDNTDPDGFARIFSQRPYPRPWNAFSGLMQHEVIIFKSCFPVSQITSNVQLAQYKRYYLQMRDVMGQHPDHVFIAVTPPPLTPAVTDAEAAARARAFADWLRSEEFLAGHPNIFTFDFFDHLAEDDPTSPDYSMLREEYRREGNDSHPNEIANETIGPILVDFVIKAVNSCRAEVRE
jgi:hypothetical protein